MYNIGSDNVLYVLDVHRSWCDTGIRFFKGMLS